MYFGPIVLVLIGCLFFAGQHAFSKNAANQVELFEYFLLLSAVSGSSIYFLVMLFTRKARQDFFRLISGREFVGRFLILGALSPISLSAYYFGASVSHILVISLMLNTSPFWIFLIDKCLKGSQVVRPNYFFTLLTVAFACIAIISLKNSYSSDQNSQFTWLSLILFLVPISFYVRQILMSHWFSNDDVYGRSAASALYSLFFSISLFGLLKYFGSTSEQIEIIVENLSMQEWVELFLGASCVTIGSLLTQIAYSKSKGQYANLGFYNLTIPVFAVILVMLRGVVIGDVPGTSISATDLILIAIFSSVVFTYNFANRETKAS